ncbi:MAG: winged helix-turn-helix domain-containing protein [Bacteroidaceae bacterium]|nr:winged helix-turn-helix domain-containing protein [Bacteroidaceae bacterium]
MLRVCYLVKIGLSNPEIANITGYPPQTVWDRVKKVRNTLNL